MDEDLKPGILDLFSGPGGLSLGFAMSKFDIVLSVDKNINAKNTIEHNFNKLKEVGLCKHHIALSEDINELKVNDIEKIFYEAGYYVSGIIGGAPCRGFTLANQQTRFLDNPQNKLVNKYIKFVKDLQPDFFLMENVPQLLSIGDGIFWKELTSELQTNDIYKITKNIINSFNYGIPQIRKRVIIIGFRNKEITEKIYPKYMNDKVNLSDAISDLPNISHGNNKSKIEYDSRKSISDYAKRLINPEIIPISSKFVHNHITSRSGPIVLERYALLQQGQNWSDLPPRLLNNYTDTRRNHSSIYRRLENDKPSVTISNIRKNMFIHPTQDRGLSVREAARIQSFPDWYEFKGGISSQQQQVSDAVPPVLAYELAKAIKSNLPELFCRS